jgi:hypothetical protein
MGTSGVEVDFADVRNGWKADIRDSALGAADGGVLASG